MLIISNFTCENLKEGVITDCKNPRFSYAVTSDLNDTEVKSAALTVNGWSTKTTEQTGIVYEGAKLQPYTTYIAKLTVEDHHGEKAEATLDFETGKLDDPWQAKWITDGSYVFKEKKVSPIPMTFRKKVSIEKPVKSARIYSTALGMYQVFINDQNISKDYFAPGFTSYKNNLQYQVYDAAGFLVNGDNEICVPVTGGWAVGSFVFTRQNRVTADRQALLLELHLEYEDGTKEIVSTDISWSVSMDGPIRMADLYDGEIYDARITNETMSWHAACEEKVKIHPKMEVSYGSPVRGHETLEATFLQTVDGEDVYDFGQNFAGVVKLNIKNAKVGQQIVVRHAEILKPNGSLNTDFLRTAKATLTYTCKDGVQEFSPLFTYMGFRYISVKGIAASDVEITGIALYSDVEENGQFFCSDERINRLQENICWGAKSNFVEIPTDCPQRDERMGWTGDIAVFAPTALYNFDASRFLSKWLRDMRAEQLPTGGIPNTIPSQGYGFPATMPVMAIDFWGDASVLVPWAMYQANGDVQVLKDNYEMMKKYVKACKWWAGLLSFGNQRYIWNTPSVLHFGDWVAPDVPQMSQWQKRSKWTATASLANTSGILSEIAGILGKEKDAEEFLAISKNTAKAYSKILMKEDGHATEEFQTAYVLPLYFNMLEGAQKENAARALVELVEKGNYCIGTGFPGTPYILFVLADNGYVDVAYKMLLNEVCPSWLYEVKSGATTIWERWDGLDENGNCPIGDDGTDMMISYNHYASGAVGDFLYRRTLGVDMIEPGYKKFKVEPVVTDDITWARGNVGTPYGEIAVNWKKENEKFMLEVEVPVGTTAVIKLSGKEAQTVGSGHYTFE